MKMYMQLLFLGLFSFNVHVVSANDSASLFDFGKLTKTYGEPKVEINLNQNLLRLITGLAKTDDPEASAILSKIEYVQVRVYTVNGKSEVAMTELEKTSKVIRKDKWLPIVSVNEEGEKVRIFTKELDGKVKGLVVMNVSYEGDAQIKSENKHDIGHGEAVFIHIKGEIDPADLSKVTDSLNIDIN